MVTIVHQYYDNHCSPTDINHTICFNEDLKKMMLKLSKYLSIHATLKKNEVVTNRIKKKKKKVVGRTEKLWRTPEFSLAHTHKGRPKAGMPQNSTSTFYHPKTTCKEQKKNREKRRGQKNPMKLRRGQSIRNRHQNLHFTQQK